MACWFTFVQPRTTCIYSHSIETVVIVTIVLKTEQPQSEAALIVFKSVIGDRVKLWGGTRLVTKIDRLNQFTDRYCTIGFVYIRHRRC